MELNIQENFPLKDLTTFKIGGPARYFAIVNNEEELKKLLNWSKDNKMKYLIIGSASNLLVADQGFAGLVIKLNFNQLEFQDERIKASADVLLSQLIALAVNRNLTGLERLTGIRGTIGGAVVGNAGAYGSEIAEVLEKVEILNEQLVKKELSKNELNFGYRESLLKHRNYIVLYVYLNLKKGKKEQSIKLMNQYAQDRYLKHPTEPSVGSTFKNIIINEEIFKKIENKGYQLPEKFIEYKKIPAAWLIEKLGLKGQNIGGAKVSEKHANHLINYHNATADEMIQLISLVKMKVRDEFGIQLEEELRYVGFD